MSLFIVRVMDNNRDSLSAKAKRMPKEFCGEIRNPQPNVWQFRPLTGKDLCEKARRALNLPDCGDAPWDYFDSYFHSFASRNAPTSALLDETAQ